MSHLSGETLARLVDEPPTALEQVHLTDCAECRAELAAMEGDVAALGALDVIAPPDSAWLSLEERLGAEGLMRRDTAHRYATMLRIAAALALFLTGTLAGFAWRGGMSAPAANAPAQVAVNTAAEPRAPTSEPEQETPAETMTPDVASTSAVDRTSASQASDAGVTPTQNDVAPMQNDDQPLPRILGPAESNARFASFEDVVPRTPQEAALLLRDAESAYLNALTRYAQLAGGSDRIDPVARLAALEGIVLTTREALGRAPADPIINGYHMTALAQREATLRQIATSTRNPWF